MSARRIHALGVAFALVLTVLPASGALAAGAVSGTVRASNGSSLSSICVDIHRASDASSFTRVQTNGVGSFSTGSLADGSYKLKFIDCVNGLYATSWYQNADSFQAATPITVSGGGVSLGSITLVSAGRISGQVTVMGSGAGVGGACVVATNMDAPSIGSDTQADGNGQFTIGGLPSGDYAVSARDCVNRDLGRGFHGEAGQIARGPDQAAAVAVAGGATTGLSTPIALSRASRIAGTVTDAADAPLSGICVLASDAASSATSGTTTAVDGSWSIGELLPGTWDVRYQDCRPGVDETDLLGTVYVNPAGSVGIKPIPTTLPAGPTAYADVAMTPGGAVGGTVTRAAFPDDLLTPTSSGTPLRGVCVGAVAPGTLTILDSTVTNSNGTFLLGGLAAGNSFRIVYFDCDENLDAGLEWYDDELVGAGDATVAISAGGTATANAALGAPLRRAAGENRRATANALALGAYPNGADAILIAREDLYPDALSGGPLGAALGAPVLLTPSFGLTPDVLSTIQTLGPRTAYILGGPVALSPNVEQQLASIGLTVAESEVFRFNGETRFETAAQIARFLTSGGSSAAYIVEGSNPDPNRGWPDAVAVSGLAAFQRVPILLVNRDQLPTATSSILLELGVTDATIVGGPVAVSDQTGNAIDAVVDNVERVFGETRYDTSAAVVQRSLEAGMWTRTTWIATGQNFPDALVAGAVVGRDGGILQLLPGSDVTTAAAALEAYGDLADGISRTILLGGPVAISEASEAALASLLGIG